MSGFDSTALEAADLQAALGMLLSRWEQNRRFFHTNAPHLAALFEQPTLEFELSLTPAGINLRHRESHQMLYPEIEGRSSLFAQSRQLAHNPLSNPLWKTISAQSPLSRQDEGRYPYTAGGINHILTHCAAEPEYQPGTLWMDSGRLLPPLISYGLLSGLHLQILIESGATLNGLLIHEPHPELFVLSAYFVDYVALLEGGHGAQLFVGPPPSAGAIAHFFTQKLITRGFVRLELTAYEHPYLATTQTRTQACARSVLRGWGSAEDELRGLANKRITLDPQNPRYGLLTGPKAIDAPICVVASGPSLSKLIDWLKIHQDHMILFSAGTALKPLIKAGIKPDFQIEIEREDHVADVLKAAPIGDIPLLAADLIHPSTLQAAQEAYLFTRDHAAASALFDPAFVLKGANPLVGNAALALALNFSREIYLLGLDAGFEEGGRVHSGGSFYDDLNDISSEAFRVEGNFGGEVFSHSLLAKSREGLEQTIAAHPSAKVFNLSFGAKIQGAQPLKTSEFGPSSCDKSAATLAIKSAFKTQGVYRDKQFDLVAALELYQQQITGVLKAGKPHTRAELNALLDGAYEATLILRKERPMEGTLLSGTLWHLLNTLHRALLQNRSPRLSELYDKGVEAIDGALEGIRRRLSSGVS